jgi:hypothetical protein
MNRTRVLVAITLLIVSACTVGVGGLPAGSSTAAPTSSPEARPSASVAAPSSSFPLGCGPSSLGPLVDERPPASSQHFGGPFDAALSTYGTLVTDIADVKARGYTPLFPSANAGARTFQLAIDQTEIDAVALLYSAAPVPSTETNEGFIAKGGFALNESPFEGQDAKDVLSTVPSNRWPVQIGPHPAALVWGDPAPDGTRSFGLYWADDVRQWELIGDADPNELVDFARSIYCQD